MGKMLYEGKAKQVFFTENQNEYLVHYKDDATAFNGEKKDVILGKGRLNLLISTKIFEMLEKNNIETHYIKKINDTDMLVKKVQILPLEVIIRNISAGSICKKLNIIEGIKFENPIFELCYKNDELGDPMINDDHALSLNLITKEELKLVKEFSLKINNLLTKFFDEINLSLVDFKIEFGRDKNNKILLADEISPDTCRLWDKDTNKKMDKDLFRRNIGDIIEGYTEVLNRIRG